jgi:hypothetical protein
MGGMFERGLFPEDTGFGFSGFQLFPHNSPPEVVPNSANMQESQRDDGPVAHLGALPEGVIPRITKEAMPAAVERYQELRGEE